MSSNQSSTDQTAKPQATKMKRKRCSSNRENSGKPKRPLSAYNFFFRHERNTYVTSALQDSVTPSELQEALQVGKNRPHRKLHGKINFASLTKRVSEKWRSITPSEKAIFEEEARIDLERYRDEISVWKASKEGSEEPKLKNRIESASSPCAGTASVDRQHINSNPLVQTTQRTVDSVQWEEHHDENVFKQKQDKHTTSKQKAPESIIKLEKGLATDISGDREHALEEFNNLNFFPPCQDLMKTFIPLLEIKDKQGEVKRFSTLKNNSFDGMQQAVNLGYTHVHGQALGCFPQHDDNRERRTRLKEPLVAQIPDSTASQATMQPAAISNIPYTGSCTINNSTPAFNTSDSSSENLQKIFQFFEPKGM